ncbi:hypothetical protein BJI69_06140 [Luteibacter rhizovicinus DSM 16549]|uniref:Molecular chaperone DnaJ n=1 Tax=Luteibacter rhizovicinus DSM 16549 TaxID=1440763 RepID=A0A1L3ER39_9GAMM|nr:J domain-containing protein [Luteibacter rhizovicinus]APG03531.1 hypothetical protein BJI69_06140 [Luteibacter rhizovicinus DSM 16549]
MAKKILSAIGTTENGIAPLPSKGQASFSALIGHIEKRRAALAEWETFDADFRRKYNDEFVLLWQGYDAVRIRLIHRLDQSHDTRGLTKGERQTIAELISQFAADVLASVAEPDIAEIHRRYNGSAGETQVAHAVEARDEVPVASTIEVPDEAEPGSPDDVLRHIQEQLDQEEARERLRREAREAHHAKRKKTPKRTATEERARLEQAEIHLSIREVYRKLASALHPDRERDPVEQQRKAALMQRVNQAYANKSLLDLLELQLELEHIDQAALENIGEDRLRRWNVILKEQLHGLDQELAEIEMDYRRRFGMSPATAVSPKTVKRALTTNITHVRESIRAFEHDLRAFDDVERLKAWLKDMRAG